MHTAKWSWLLPDTESTSPSGRNTDNDADPFTESKDEEELEDNETGSYVKKSWFDHVPDLYTSCGY